jgi:hypothetical protein
MTDGETVARRRATVPADLRLGLTAAEIKLNSFVG